MNPPTKPHTSPAHGAGHETQAESDEPDDPTPWNPGKPLADLISFMEFGD